jgi:hypothetical protein
MLGYSRGKVVFRDGAVADDGQHLLLGHAFLKAERTGHS